MCSNIRQVAWALTILSCPPWPPYNLTVRVTWTPAPMLASPCPPLPPYKKILHAPLWDNCVLCVILFNKTCIKKIPIFVVFFIHVINNTHSPPPTPIKMCQYYLMGIIESSDFRHKWMIEEVTTEGMQETMRWPFIQYFEKKRVCCCPWRYDRGPQVPPPPSPTLRHWIQPYILPFKLDKIFPKILLCLECFNYHNTVLFCKKSRVGTAGQSSPKLFKRNENPGWAVLPQDIY